MNNTKACCLGRCLMSITNQYGTLKGLFILDALYFLSFCIINIFAVVYEIKNFTAYSRPITVFQATINIILIVVYGLSTIAAFTYMLSPNANWDLGQEQYNEYKWSRTFYILTQNFKLLLECMALGWIKIITSPNSQKHRNSERHHKEIVFAYLVFFWTASMICLSFLLLKIGNNFVSFLSFVDKFSWTQAPRIKQQKNRLLLQKRMMMRRLI